MKRVRVRAGFAFIARAKILWNTGTLHPVANEFADVLVRLLIERGDHVGDVEAAAAPRIEHVAERIGKSFLAVAILQSEKEQQTFRANDVVRLGLSGLAARAERF